MGVTHGKGLLLVLMTRSAGQTINRHGSIRRSGWTRGLWITKRYPDPLGGSNLLYRINPQHWINQLFFLNRHRFLFNRFSLEL